jgi:hypothetical protein
MRTRVIVKHRLNLERLSDIGTGEEVHHADRSLIVTWPSVWCATPRQIGGTTGAVNRRAGLATLTTRPPRPVVPQPKMLFEQINQLL